MAIHNFKWAKNARGDPGGFGHNVQLDSRSRLWIDDVTTQSPPSVKTLRDTSNQDQLSGRHCLIFWLATFCLKVFFQMQV